MNPRQKIHGRALKELESVLGRDNLFVDDIALASYSYDATPFSPEGTHRILPGAVAFPEAPGQVRAIAELANQHGFALVPRGAGTGMTGGARPVPGCLVVCFSKMSRVEVYPKDLVAYVQPGVVTARIQELAEKAGLFYPPDPASREACTIGGNLAENSGGLRAVKYGVTRDYVLGLDAVLGDGTVVKAGARTRKCVAGLDLVSLLVGSEGTLGMITGAWLKLIPLPEAKATLLALFEDVGKAASAVPEILAARLAPAALEIMDSHTLSCVWEELETIWSHGLEKKSLGAALLVEVDGERMDTERRLGDTQDILKANGAVGITTAVTEKDRDSIWRARRAVSPALGKMAPYKVDEDVAVPISRLAEMVAGVEEIGRRYGLDCATYGHAGDGNLHVNFLVPDETALAEKAEKAASDLFDLALAMGGTITGEHGTGTSKRMFLEREIGSQGIDVLKRLKKAFDPKGILNPGKIIPETPAVQEGSRP